MSWLFSGCLQSKFGNHAPFPLHPENGTMKIQNFLCKHYMINPSYWLFKTGDTNISSNPWKRQLQRQHKKIYFIKTALSNKQRQFIWLQVYLFLKRSLRPVFIRSISSFRFVCIEPVLYIYPINNYSSIFQLGIHWLNPEFKLLNSSFFSVNVELRLIIWTGGFRLNIFSKKFTLSTPIFCKIYVVWLVWTV